jgi:molybdopterin molybdotransferase
MKLLKVDTIVEVQEKLDLYFRDLVKEEERISLRDANGRYLAEDVNADLNLPAFRRSVVDGYAVRGADTFGVSDSAPVFLDVKGSVDMGVTTELIIGPGETAYVPTGGMIPEGADSMVMIEHVDHLGDTVIGVNRPTAPNADLMNIGDDLKAGQRYFQKGHRIETKDIGLLAACGKEKVSVYRKPTMTILSTGDELVAPSQTPGPGQIRDINAYAIAAFAESAGAQVLSVSILRDQWGPLREAILQALPESDLVILSGGSSAGAKDMTAQVIDSLGKPGVITHGLAIKPGKPTIIGILSGEKGNKAIIGLPGHPLSSIIVYDVVVNGFLKKYYLGNEETTKTISAMMAENVHAGEGRETYQLVTLLPIDKPGADCRAIWRAEPIRAKSGSILQLAAADGYVVIPAGAEGVYEDQVVQVIPLVAR